MVCYHYSLVKLPSTHPDDEFKIGLFSIHHTEKSFSGSPIDLTLEQTINADAANQTKGITAITNSICARQRWAESHSLRTALLTLMFNNLAINKKDVSRDLKPYKIKSDTKSLNKMLSMIYGTLNPFDVNVDNRKISKGRNHCVSFINLSDRERDETKVY